MTGARQAGVLAAVLASLALASPAAAVPAGSDLFVTDPDSTQFTFGGDFTIPAGFFGPGSEPFSGTVAFGGVPLRGLGDADTVVRRTEPAELPAVPGTDTVPVEILQLQLQSVQPIRVKVGAGTELWDVDVGLSPTRSVAGQMTITKTSELGGTFDSTLPVFPVFTFSRVSDGAVRTLDVGQLPLSPQAVQALTFRADNVPWFNGDCPGSVLHVPGVNDGFCPGVKPGGEKQLTLEQSQLARHGIYPAQPLQNHYKCYEAEPRTKFRPREVQLVDQLGFERVRVLKPVTLCNPVKKNAERIENKLAHLKCYSIKTLEEQPTFTGRQFFVRNQFGTAMVTVGKAVRLCLPSRKQIVGKRGQAPLGTGSGGLTELGDHFKCYKASGGTGAATVSLSDQFDVERVRVAKLRYLCNPVQKDDTRIQHPLSHLACYQIVALKRQPPFSPVTVRVRNQFGVEVLRVVRPETLCVPSLKIRKDGGGGPPPGIPPDVDLTCQPSSVTVPAGGSVRVTCRVAAVGGTPGQTRQVTVDCQGSQGVQCDPSQRSGTLAVSSFFDVSFDLSASLPGQATITSRSQGESESVQVQVAVKGGGGGQPPYSYRSSATA